MKNYIILSLAIVFGLTSTSFAQTKIGTVDMKTVFEKYWRTKEAESKMSEIRASVKRELDDRNEKRKTLEADITKLNDQLKQPELSAKKKEEASGDREKKIGQWQAMMKDLQAYQVEKEKSVQDQTLRIRNGIVDEIKKVVDDIVKSENYDLVFDVSGNSINNVPVIMHAKSSYDFTKGVVDRLNADRKAPPADDAKKPEKKDK